MRYGLLGGLALAGFGTLAYSQWQAPPPGCTTLLGRCDGSWAVPVAEATWGAVVGTLSSQTDLQAALDAKAATSHSHSGSVSQMIVPLVADGASVAWTNMPAAVTFFSGSHRYATKLDLTNYTEARLIVNKQATAGAAASVVRLRYRTAFDTTVGNWLTAGTSEVQVAVNVANTVQVSAWIPLVAGAKADVFVTLDGSGGDGVLDPAFGAISAQFR